MYIISNNRGRLNISPSLKKAANLPLVHLTFFFKHKQRNLPEWPILTSKLSGTVHPSVNRVRLGALQPSAVNKSINKGTTKAQRIDLPLKMQSCDVISPLHCLNGLKIVVELQCHPGPFGAACLCFLLHECPTLFN